MVKRAVCVGINRYPRPDLELRGCVNDAKAWATLLTAHFDFTTADVRLLTNAKATKRAILAALGDLLAGASRGDVLVFTNSSHGTYVADRDSDEPRYDEALCPYDCETDVIVDDELRGLFAGIPSGVRLTVISDSCHSGSVTRDAMRETPDGRRKRYVDPRVLGRPVVPDVRRAHPKRETSYPESSMNELLLSGCRSDQYSYDARFGRKYHGAMTNTAMGIITGADYRLTYGQLHRRLVPALRDDGYDQEPQLEGRTSAKRRQLFT